MSTTVTQTTPRAGKTYTNALLGAVATIVLSFVPFSPVLGGGIAGYLQHGTRGEGVKVGAISGVIATIPVVGIVLLAASLFTIVPAGSDVLGLAIGGLVLGLVTFLVAGIYTVGLAALGGYIGAYLAEDRLN
ncbi:hypothetical protein SAMN04487950_1122 [Halogranum rubrum]|uniref:DUF5518 domain-containing protein n=2 Tax=Halogranum rubrum TaxID=553466 RepID=A0A1I4CHI0_9EURY|nr:MULTISPECIES: DUF5518 domain-containing protein [Halogranum]EJN59385.1 hypothetical protein HSB1_28060 [Halogranum salarium B-1]SFK79431.1 hypothetical protein SAMN04487950_1122 [Halogranum rubrum]